MPETSQAFSNAYDLSIKYDRVHYKMGARNPDSGQVDCSAWVGFLQKNAMEGINQKLGQIIFSKQEIQALNSTSEDQIINASKQTGILIRGKDVTPDKLKEGMIIGEDNGATKHDRGRQYGIDHIVMVVKNPTTGELMISQSHSGNNDGVDLTSIDSYFSKKNANGAELFLTDPLAKARYLIETKQQEQVPVTTPTETQINPASHSAQNVHDVLNKGDRGEEIKQVQQMLASLGANIDVDGIYGPKTEQVVKGYQMMNGLEVDGIVGPKTMAALKEDVKAIGLESKDHFVSTMVPTSSQDTSQSLIHEQTNHISDRLKILSSQAQKLYTECEGHVKSYCAEQGVSWSTNLNNSVAALAAVAHKRGFPGVNVFDVSQAGVFIGYENARGDIFQQALLNGKEIAQIPAQTSLNQIAEQDQRMQHEVRHTQARNMSHSMP